MNTYLLIGFIILLIMYLYPLKIFRMVFGRKQIVYNIAPSENKYDESNLCITIDDVPYRDETVLEDILDTFRDTNHKLTFFIISSYVNRKNRKLLVRAVEEGHFLANHGVTNRNHYLLSNREINKEIYDCQEVLDSIYVEANKEPENYIYYRPGCGYVNSYMKELERNGDIKIILGSVYPNDAFVPIAKINSLYLRTKIGSMDIIILHDRKWTPDTLINLKYWLGQKKLVSLSINSCV